jgi:hypothetical protein
MTWRKSHKRTYLYGCPLCHRWSSVATLEEQAALREQGACATCCADQGWMLRVRIAALEQHLAEIKARGLALPLEEREPIRVIYRHKHAHLVQAQERLAAFLAQQAQPEAVDAP